MHLKVKNIIEDAVEILKEIGLGKDFNYGALVTEISGRYNAVAYHNFTHAVDVCQMCFLSWKFNEAQPIRALLPLFCSIMSRYGGIFDICIQVLKDINKIDSIDGIDMKRTSPLKSLSIGLTLQLLENLTGSGQTVFS